MIIITKRAYHDIKVQLINSDHNPYETKNLMNLNICCLQYSLSDFYALVYSFMEGTRTCIL